MLRVAPLATTFPLFQFHLVPSLQLVSGFVHAIHYDRPSLEAFQIGSSQLPESAFITPSSLHPLAWDPQ